MNKEKYRCRRCGAWFRVWIEDHEIVDGLCGTCFAFFEFGVEDPRVPSPPNVNDLVDQSERNGEKT